MVEEIERAAWDAFYGQTLKLEVALKAALKAGGIEVEE